MDENYLDNLLNELSLDKEIDHNVEDELDNQLQSEKEKHQEAVNLSKDDIFNMDLNQDAESIDINGDIHFSETQINELDDLDELADLDIGNMDFSDIDFDDLDVTNLEELPDDQDLDSLLKEFDGNLDIEDYFDEPFSDKKEDIAVQFSDTEEKEVDEQSPDIKKVEVDEQSPDTGKTEEDEQVPDTGKVDEQTFDADQFLDSLLTEETIDQIKDEPIQELPEEEFQQEETAVLPTEEALEDVIKQDESVKQEDIRPSEDLSATGGEDDLEDLFALLDLEENGSASNDQIGASATGTDHSQSDNGMDALAELEDLDSVSEASQPKKKKSFMTILFGEPDEDDELSPEELGAIEKKKAAKKAKKEAAKKEKEEKKAAAKAEKDTKAGNKKKAQEEKKRVKAVKKAQLKEEAAKNAEPEKPLNRPAVAFIFSLFLGGTLLFYLGTNNFNYTLAIQKATDYFDNQKYHKAYDEIKGVDVKEKDQELKDRIYTVMYVERLYESYQNNLELDRQKKALDSLLRGVDKYYEYYDEAQQLGIVEDLDYSFAQIQTALQDNYGITVEQAVAINQLESYEYVQTVNQYVQDGKW